MKWSLDSQDVPGLNFDRHIAWMVTLQKNVHTMNHHIFPVLPENAGKNNRKGLALDVSLNLYAPSFDERGMSS